MSSFDLEQSKNADTYFYADALFESLMINKKEVLEKETGLELFPTYSFWRMYTHLADLSFHKDRPACEISVTVNLGGSEEPWPIYMEDTPLELKPGDAAVYLGCEVVHGRHEFQGDWQAQCFMHYVDKNGPHKEWDKDKRVCYGINNENMAR